MHQRLPRPLRLLCATLQVALIGAWSPVMLAGMALHPGDDPMPGMEHSGPSHQGAHPLECCALCPLACAAPVGLASAPLSLPLPAAVAHVPAPAARTTLPYVLHERRLPFPLGPPAPHNV